VTVVEVDPFVVMAALIPVARPLNSCALSICASADAHTEKITAAQKYNETDNVLPLLISVLP
jgi:hypothetical protein